MVVHVGVGIFRGGLFHPSSLRYAQEKRLFQRMGLKCLMYNKAGRVPYLYKHVKLTKNGSSIAKAEASTMSRKYVRHLVYVEVALLVAVSAAAIIAWSWRVSTLLRL